MFLPATVPDPPVHGDLEGEGLDWEVSNTHHCAELSMDNSLKFDLTDVQHAIGSVSGPSVIAFSQLTGVNPRFLVHYFPYQALQELSPSGHGVFLKTNWSAPKDASFLIGTMAASFIFKLPVTAATGSLQVQAIADVLAMLKSSTCTALDLDACENLFLSVYQFTTLFVSFSSGAACGCSPTLCIRSFVAIPPQNEFRVFFVSTIAVAASQRHVHQFYPHLHRDIAECNQRIHNFCSLLSSKLPLPSCVVDIAFTEQSPKVRLSSLFLCSNFLLTFLRRDL